MKIPILIEPTPERRFVATGIAPFAETGEGSTPDEAVSRVKALIEARVAKGARITSVDVPDESNPWLAGAGMFHGDPLFDEWQRAIADYRRVANECADTP